MNSVVISFPFIKPSIIPEKNSPQENNVNASAINVFLELFDANKPLLFGKHSNFFLFKPKVKIRL